MLVPLFVMRLCLPCLRQDMQAHDAKVEMTHHESRLDNPKRIGANGARRAGGHGGQYVETPRVLAHDRLVALGRGRGIESLVRAIRDSFD